MVFEYIYLSVFMIKKYLSGFNLYLDGILLNVSGI